MTSELFAIAYVKIEKSHLNSVIRAVTSLFLVVTLSRFSDFLSLPLCLINPKHAFFILHILFFTRNDISPSEMRNGTRRLASIGHVSDLPTFSSPTERVKVPSGKWRCASFTLRVPMHVVHSSSKNVQFRSSSDRRVLREKRIAFIVRLRTVRPVIPLATCCPGKHDISDTSGQRSGSIVRFSWHSRRASGTRSIQDLFPRGMLFPSHHPHTIRTHRQKRMQGVLSNAIN